MLDIGHGYFFQVCSHLHIMQIKYVNGGYYIVTTHFLNGVDDTIVSLRTASIKYFTIMMSELNNCSAGITENQLYLFRFKISSPGIKIPNRSSLKRIWVSLNSSSNITGLPFASFIPTYSPPTNRICPFSM